MSISWNQREAGCRNSPSDCWQFYSIVFTSQNKTTASNLLPRKKVESTTHFFYWSITLLHSWMGRIVHQERKQISARNDATAIFQKSAAFFPQQLSTQKRPPVLIWGISGYFSFSHQLQTCSGIQRAFSTCLIFNTINTVSFVSWWLR